MSLSSFVALAAKSAQRDFANGVGVNRKGEAAMITISLCMIVKNEEKVLARCLDSVADLVDEVIIVDTGSEDSTKEIAARYTDKVYDFAWVDDFSKARNFAFSKASMEYIYSADADEVLSEENRERYRKLKAELNPQVELVQMMYANQLAFDSIYNYDVEYRPKLYRRERTFEWVGAVHEMVRLEPVIYDSNIVITHLPLENHAKRDLRTFQRQVREGVVLDKRLRSMYARELLMAGDAEDLQSAQLFFKNAVMDSNCSSEEIEEACCVLSRTARITHDVPAFLKYTSKVIAGDGCSEVCYDLGAFYEEQQDYEEASIWYYNAVYEVQPILCRKTGGEDSLRGLIRCYEKLQNEEQAEIYRQELQKTLDEIAVS